MRQRINLSILEDQITGTKTKCKLFPPWTRIIRRAKQTMMQSQFDPNLTNSLRVLAIIAGAMLANACAQPGGDAPAIKVAADGEPTPTSVEQVRTQCWMRYEGPKQVKNLDEKMKLVDKCIDEKMKLLPPTANR